MGWRVRPARIKFMSMGSRAISLAALLLLAACRSFESSTVSRGVEVDDTPPECLTCEQASQELSGLLDCSKVAGKAEAGPAEGTERAVLCARTLHCLRTTNCAAVSALDCYCGSTSERDCFEGPSAGPCRDVLETSLETSTGSLVSARFLDPTYGGGFALLRITGDADHCAAECFR